MSKVSSKFTEDIPTKSLKEKEKKRKKSKKRKRKEIVYIN